jgi:serine/threonine protein phosphatase PrpC
VADGHNGVEAAEAALGAVGQHAGALLDDGTREPGELVTALARAARTAVAEQISGWDPPRDRSRTAMTLALCAERSICTLTYGDTVAAVVRGRGGSVVSRSSAFLGPSTPTPGVRQLRRRGGQPVVVASDGLVDFTGRTLGRTLVEATSSQPDATAAARHLVQAAGDFGAGDNVAVAVLL